MKLIVGLLAAIGVFTVAMTVVIVVVMGSGSAPPTITMDELTANPSKFVGDHVRVKGRVLANPDFRRDTQWFVLIPVACDASKSSLSSDDTRQALADCYGNDPREQILGLQWTVAEIPDDLDIASGDVVTIDTRISASSGGATYHFQQSVDSEPFSARVVSIHSDDE